MYLGAQRIAHRGWPFNKGAQFFTADGHAVQGDGEVDGGAVEISLTATLQFIVHKSKTIKLAAGRDRLSHHRLER
jgi:acetamidase/formamidase